VQKLDVYQAGCGGQGGEIVPIVVVVVVRKLPVLQIVIPLDEVQT